MEKNSCVMNSVHSGLLLKLSTGGRNEGCVE